MRLCYLAEEYRPDFSGLYFHGTSLDFKVPKRRGPYRGRTDPSAVGVWFTKDPDVAEQFAITGLRWREGQPRVVSAYLAIHNPWVVEHYEDFLEEWRRFRDANRLRRSLQRRGYDAIVILHSDTDVLRDRTRIDVCVLQDGIMRGFTSEPVQVPEEA